MLRHDLDGLRMHNKYNANIIFWSIIACKFAKIINIISLHIETVVFSKHIFYTPVMMFFETCNPLRHYSVIPMGFAQYTIQ